VVADLGARYLGYSAEYCRTFVTGRPFPKVKEMYHVLMDAYRAGIDQLRPGKRASEADKTIRDWIAAAGYPDYPHATGHGIGMANGEYPTVNQDVDAELEPGMVICLEPGIYIPGVGGVKEEDLILVTDGAPVILTYTPYDPALIGDG
jgi:Xaa-Pro aminopeptidase